MKRQLTKLEQDISSILFEFDPIGVGSVISNPHSDEYDAEAKDIAERLPACSSLNQVTDMIHDVLIKWFTKEVVKSDKSSLQPLAKKIYSLKG